MQIAFIIINMLFKTTKGFNINILDYRPLVGKYIKDLRSMNYVSYDMMDDLYQEGMIGLIKAEKNLIHQEILVLLTIANRGLNT